MVNVLSSVLLSGNVDAVSHFQRADVVTIKYDPRFRIYYEVWDDLQSVVAIAWHHNHPMLRDPRVGRALTHAINRRDVRRVLNMCEGDLPFTYLVLNVETYVAHRRVKGLSSPFRANPLWSAEHLSIEAGR